MKTVALSGRTGQGVETAGEMLAAILADEGMVYRTWRDFSTIIRGGITAFEISLLEVDDGASDASDDVPEMFRTLAVDLAVVWDDACAEVYRQRVFDVAGLFGSATVTGLLPENFEESPRIGYNMWALGVVAGAFQLNDARVADLIANKFSDESNRTWFYRGYTKGARRPLTLNPQIASEMVRMSGNQAFCLGALAAGVRFYCGYPITPASDILEILAAKLPEINGATFQVEDEIAAIHMAIGASYAGLRTFVATSGPGLSLMTEGIGYAATIEVPLVVVDNQRGGPSTGMPTKIEQSDVNHALYGGHGEFARVVLAPTDILDGVLVMQEAFNLADSYQCVVMVLSDLDLALNQKSYPWSRIESLLTHGIDRGTTVTKGSISGYRRFAHDAGARSIRTVPGVVGGAYVASGDEHDERGWMEPNFTESRATVHRRRLDKLHDFGYKRPWQQVGCARAPIVLMGMGAMCEIIRGLCLRSPEKYQGLLIRQLAPMPELPRLSAEVHMVIVSEYNATGPLRRLLGSWIGTIPVQSVRRYDGEHFTLEEFETAVYAVESREGGGDGDGRAPI